MVREKGKNGRSAEVRNVPRNVPGMFSDDESESDAGRSSDTDRDDSLGGGGGGGSGPDNPAVLAAAAAAARDGVSRGGSSGGDAEPTVGARDSGHLGAAGGFEGRDDLVGGRRHANGSPVRRPGGAGAPSTPPGLTLRSRAAAPSPGDAAVVAGTAAGDVVSGTEGVEGVGAVTCGASSAVLVERCYVMVSCHRNHPLMFKVR